MVLGALLEALLGAFEGVAVRKNLHRYGEPLRARGDPEGADVERVVGDAQRRQPRQVQTPHLGTAAAVGEKIKRAAVGRPARARVIGRNARGTLRLPGRIGQIQQPQARVSLVGVHVGLALHEGEHAPVGGDLRVADALQTHQVLDREGRRRGGGEHAGAAEGGKAQDQTRCEAEQKTHVGRSP